MVQEQVQLASFNYKHGSRIRLSARRKMAFVIALLGALVLAKLLFPFGLLALGVPAMIYLAGERTLILGPRYLICGDQIIYYANVTQLKFSEADGTLSLQTGKVVPFVIERERFPDNARKANSLAENKATTFNKVAMHIVEHVRHASPPVAGEAGSIFCPSDPGPLSSPEFQIQASALKRETPGERAGLERTACTVECFLNALRLEDGPERTVTEEWVVRWLAGRAHRRDDCVIYSKSMIDCYSGGKVTKRFAMPDATQTRTIWCDGSTLSGIDGEEFLGSGKRVMLGMAGLILSMPGLPEAARP